MTEETRTSGVSTFGDNTSCDKPECQKQIKNLTNENELLHFDAKHKISLLEHQRNQFKHLYSQEKSAFDAFQGNFYHDGKIPTQATCPACIGHRAALIRHREFNAVNIDALTERHNNDMQTFDSIRKELMAEKIENGRLKSQLREKTNSESKYKGMLERVNDEKETYKQHLAIMKHRASSLETELIGVKVKNEYLMHSSSGSKRTIEDVHTNDED